MITLQPIRVIVHLMSLQLDQTDKNSLFASFHYLQNLAISMPMILLLIPLIAYFYYNLANITKATEAFYVIAATLMCIGQYWFLVVQKEPIFKLLAQLQMLVDQSNLILFLFIIMNTLQ